MIAPIVFAESLSAECFEKWLNLYFLPSLSAASILIMDNVPIHHKAAIKELAKEKGHGVLFLLKYSPDLNDIEHDLNTLK